MSPHEEFVCRMALADLSPRLRGLSRTNELIVQFSTDELGQITTEAQELARELGRDR
jgi:hypothetical protein